MTFRLFVACFLWLATTTVHAAEWRASPVLKTFSASDGWSSDRHPRLLGDVNGDGRQDIVGFADDGVYLALAGSLGFFTPQKVLAAFTINTGGWSVANHPRLLGDVNGDGRDDIVGFANGGVYLSLSTGKAFTQPRLALEKAFGYSNGWRVSRHPRMLSDVNNDGRMDVVGFANGGAYVSLSTGTAFANAYKASGGYGYSSGWRVDRHPRYMADVTGDGVDDIVGFANAGVYVAVNDGKGRFAPAKQYINNFGYNAGSWRVERHPRFMADVNGDRRADVVGFGNNGVYVSFSRGAGFDQPRLMISNYGYTAGSWRVERHPRYMADVDGDGREDVVGFGNAGAFVSLSKGTAFAEPERILGVMGYNQGWRVIAHPRHVTDLDNDGRADILGFGPDVTAMARAAQEGRDQLAYGLETNKRDIALCAFGANESANRCMRLSKLSEVDSTKELVPTLAQLIDELDDTVDGFVGCFQGQALFVGDVVGDSDSDPSLLRTAVTSKATSREVSSRRQQCISEAQNSAGSNLVPTRSQSGFVGSVLQGATTGAAGYRSQAVSYVDQLVGNCDQRSTGLEDGLVVGITLAAFAFIEGKCEKYGVEAECAIAAYCSIPPNLPTCAMVAGVVAATSDDDVQTTQSNYAIQCEEDSNGEQSCIVLDCDRVDNLDEPACSIDASDDAATASSTESGGGGTKSYDAEQMTCSDMAQAWNLFKQQCELSNWSTYRCDQFLRRTSRCVDTSLIRPGIDGDNTCPFDQPVSITDFHCETQGGIWSCRDQECSCVLSDPTIERLQPSFDLCHDPAADLLPDQCVDFGTDGLAGPGPDPAPLPTR